MILILGAGPAGLAMALACHKFGLCCQVVDRYHELVQGRGGLQITPNGMAVLRALGVADGLIKVAVRARRISIADLATRRPICDLAVATLAGHRSQDYVLLRRRDLIGILQDAVTAAGIQIEKGLDIETLQASAACVAWRAARGRQGEAGLVVGADGVDSLTRRIMTGTPGFVPPRFQVWRTSLPASDAGCTTRPGQVLLHVGKRRHLVCYQAGVDGDINVVAVEALHGGPGRSSGDPPAWLARLLPVTKEHFGDPVGLVHTLSQAAHHRQVWYNDQMVLIGDALHPMLPFLAQGANMALEDAFVLARSLARGPQPARGFERYRQERTKRIRKVIRFSNRQVMLNHVLLPRLGWAGAAGLGMISTLLPGLVAHRYRWIFNTDVTRS